MHRELPSWHEIQHYTGAPRPNGRPSNTFRASRGRHFSIQGVDAAKGGIHFSSAFPRALRQTAHSKPRDCRASTTSCELRAGWSRGSPLLALSGSSINTTADPTCEHWPTVRLLAIASRTGPMDSNSTGQVSSKRSREIAQAFSMALKSCDTFGNSSTSFMPQRFMACRASGVHKHFS